MAVFDQPLVKVGRSRGEAFAIYKIVMPIVHEISFIS